MTPKEFRKLPAGTLVRWSGGEDAGTVVIEGNRHFVQWTDGQQTDGTDDWALKNVERMANERH